MPSVSAPLSVCVLEKRLESIAGDAEYQPWAMQDRLTELALARLAVGTAGSPAIWELDASAADFDDFFAELLAEVQVSPFVRRFFEVK